VTASPDPAEAEARAGVEAAEAALRAAMLAGDVSALDRLLSDELIFTDQAGRLLGKQDDLSAYRAGLLRLSRADSTERAIRLAGDAAIVTLRAELAGRWDGNAFAGAFRYTRVWRRGAEGWQLLAAHCSGA
jgi:ketosteroid isomerase-like protein